MPHSFGYRARTRHLFARNFREHGPTHLSTYLEVYKVGDIVDVHANASIHRGMPHRFYHGRTGIVYNVTPRAVGVIVNKTVGNRIIPKRINVRIEHVAHSTCRQDFLERVKANEAKKKEARAKGEKLPVSALKRQPPQPRAAHVVTTANNKPKTVAPVPYELLV
jgi:large subunit ribosomal protein L21e